MKKKLLHYGSIFAAAFAVTALASADHLFDAHGLNALGAAALSLLITALKAGVDAVTAVIITSPDSPTG